MKKTVNGLAKKELTFWWPIIVAAIGVAIAWGTLSTKVTQNARACEELSDKLTVQQEECRYNHDKLNLTLTEIEVKLAQIQKDIEYIKLQIK